MMLTVWKLVREEIPEEEEERDDTPVRNGGICAILDETGCVTLLLTYL